MRAIIPAVLFVLCAAGAFAQCPLATPSNWCSGTYQYDGAGNVTAMGADTYVYDELGRDQEAMDHYRRALSLNPQYADAHFNIALLCERQGDALKAVHHWKAYLKLDGAGQWAEIARRQLERLRQTVIR